MSERHINPLILVPLNIPYTTAWLAGVFGGHKSNQFVTSVRHLGQLVV